MISNGAHIERSEQLFIGRAVLEERDMSELAFAHALASRWLDSVSSHDKCPMPVPSARSLTPEMSDTRSPR